MLNEGSIKTAMWKETTPDFKQFEMKGDTLEGKLLGYTDIQIKGITVKRWQILRPDDGGIVGFLGGVSLDSMLQAVPPDAVIKLEYQGKVKVGSGYHVKVFKIYYQVENEQKLPKERSSPKSNK